MNLLEAATQIHPQTNNDSKDYAMSVELIIAVVVLLLQQCDLDIPNIISRSRKLAFTDRVRIRVLCLRHGLRIRDLADHLQNFCNRHDDVVLADLITEAREL